ncbi:hypothetical protein M1146_07395, partial [Patescibacteria group bacterium]|nr:hypothetical protein [Patescibacteria group bacterium]
SLSSISSFSAPASQSPIPLHTSPYLPTAQAIKPTSPCPMKAASICGLSATQTILRDRDWNMPPARPCDDQRDQSSPTGF